MSHDLILTFYFLMWFALVGLTVLFIISGIDDIMIDTCYWLRYLYRLFKTKEYPPLTYEQLLDKKEQPIAILIPCWQEANVIGDMLEHNCNEIDYKNYTIFVGIYPNDPETIQEVELVSETLTQIQCVIGQQPGPTNKASNLNQLYTAAKIFEKKHHKVFEVFLFHDAEDVIHPLSFKLYNYLIPRKDMIQLPVFPLETPHWNFTHWLYADEFSENHTKNMVVREAMNLHIPSAGVGTAFSKRVIQALQEEEGTLPFSESSLTEDYRTSFAVRRLGFKQIFLTQTILKTKWVKKGFFGAKHKKTIVKERIATRAMFPLKYYESVRQKTRWIVGIIFQEWESSLWPKSWRLRYSVAHDRKAFITHFINGFSYIVFSFWMVYFFSTRGNPNYPSLQEQFNLHPWVWLLLSSGIFIMLERLTQRFIATTRLYGTLAGLLSVPRTFYGNILNLHALIRAYIFYLNSTTVKPKKNAPNAANVSKVSWDKTEHSFPGRHLLIPYHKRLGDLLLQSNYLTEDQLKLAIIAQRHTGERLGEILLRLELITKPVLLNYIAQQYALTLFPHSQCQSAFEAHKNLLSKKNISWLTKNKLYLLKINATKTEINLGITDPTNELLLHKAIHYFSNYNVTFLLVNPHQ